MILDAHNLPAQDHLVICLALCSVTFNLIHIQEEIITDQIALSSLDTLCMLFVQSILNTHAFCYKKKNDLKTLEALQCVSFAREWRIHVREVYFCSQFWGISSFYCTGCDEAQQLTSQRANTQEWLANCFPFFILPRVWVVPPTGVEYPTITSFWKAIWDIHRGLPEYFRHFSVQSS